MKALDRDEAAPAEPAPHARESGVPLHSALRTDEATDSLEPLLRQVARLEAAPAESARFAPSTSLAGGRLRIERRLGVGGMGVVYEAFDTARQTPVALKTLGRLEPQGLYRLKREFRAVAELSHPNIVRLHELFVDDDVCFFTMERVDGQRLDAWLAAREQSSGCSADTADEARILAAFTQLASALAAIHAAGMAHCDLKPSNVLVSAAGQVTLLDFGLARERLSPSLAAHGEREVVGTPAYMAPEQARGAPEPASDAYALGVMLYEAWSGELPFSGTSAQLLRAKQSDNAPPLAAPRRWARLCSQLLQHDPAARPSLSAVREQLLQWQGASDSTRSEPANDQLEAPLFVGRERELGLLAAWHDEARARPGLVVRLWGESGIGKSALLEAFARQVRGRDDARVLMGRCHERENVPYKGFDRVVDELSRELRRWPAQRLQPLPARDVALVAQLFPVLRRVPAIATRKRAPLADLREWRQHAFAALRRLLAAVCAAGPLVLCIDDLQWLDEDTCALLEFLLTHPEPLPLLLVLSQRAASGEAGLAGTILGATRSNTALRLRELQLGPLAPEPALALAREHLTRLNRTAEPLAQRVGRDAAGVPFLIGELARCVSAEADPLAAPISLEQAMARRLSLLPEGARRTLQLLALIGRPLPLSDLGPALDIAAPHDVFDQLRKQRLVRRDPLAARDVWLECYHDRVRESVSAALSRSQRQALYACLAQTLAQRADADPELLAECWAQTGASERAAQAFERGAERALDMLAFERAAQLYAQALAQRAPDDRARPALLIKRGDALVDAGHGVEAAHAYLEAAESGASEQAAQLQRKAAYHLMTAGHVDEGRALLTRVLAAVGIRVPRHPVEGVLGALVSRARLRLRGLALTPDAAPSQRDQQRLEAFLTVVQGWVGANPFVVADMSARYLQLSLSRGARVHAARALAYQGYLESAAGLRGETSAFRLIARAEVLAEAAGDPNALAFVLAIGVGGRVNTGRFADALQHIGRPAELFLTRCRGVSFERSVLRVWEQVGRYHLGQLRALVPLTESVVEDAQARGDRWAATLLATRYAVPALLSQLPVSEVEARLAAAERRYRKQATYQWLDAYLLFARQNLLRYEGRPEAALELLQAHWPAFRRGMFLRVQMPRTLFLYERAGTALEVLRRARRPQPAHQRLIAQTINALRSTHVAHAPAFATLLEAGLAAREGRDTDAIPALRTATATLDRLGLQMYAAAARLQLATLLGGAEGSDVQRTARAAFEAEGVREPAAYARFLVPGFA